MRANCPPKWASLKESYRTILLYPWFIPSSRPLQRFSYLIPVGSDQFLFFTSLPPLFFSNISVSVWCSRVRVNESKLSTKTGLPRRKLPYYILLDPWFISSSRPLQRFSYRERNPIVTFSQYWHFCQCSSLEYLLDYWQGYNRWV